MLLLRCCLQIGVVLARFLSFLLPSSGIIQGAIYATTSLARPTVDLVRVWHAELVWRSLGDASMQLSLMSRNQHAFPLVPFWVR